MKLPLDKLYMYCIRSKKKIRPTSAICVCQQIYRKCTQRYSPWAVTQFGRCDVYNEGRLQGMVYKIAVVTLVIVQDVRKEMFI